MKDTEEKQTPNPHYRDLDHRSQEQREYDQHMEDEANKYAFWKLSRKD